ncbi:hypothetical protein [Prosthecomicrobium pneumaticum]|uniref:Uncharacterized protein n=1 Tax=Prosthecomicrobium pneumaticum TaxID=81895 RepID=A0A7W9L3I9_9HYPH|nr:hypothetical protein [Prosthecomicrobium pneumaticum]MBB5754613.1 hypothetical protein [Prosthecomicrobium pneumaticum]
MTLAYGKQVTGLRAAGASDDGRHVQFEIAEKGGQVNRFIAETGVLNKIVWGLQAAGELARKARTGPAAEAMRVEIRNFEIGEASAPGGDTKVFLRLDLGGLLGNALLTPEQAKAIAGALTDAADKAEAEQRGTAQ